MVSRRADPASSFQLALNSLPRLPNKDGSAINSVKERGSHGALCSVKERGRVKQIYAALRSLGRGRSLYVLNSQLSTLNSQPSTPRLLSYFFKLGVEHIHSPVGVKVTAQRDVKPVALFALNDKSVGFAGRALSRLRDYVDHQIPSARLSHFSQRARNCFFLFLCPAGIRTNSDQSSDISAV